MKRVLNIALEFIYISIIQLSYWSQALVLNNPEELEQRSQVLPHNLTPVYMKDHTCIAQAIKDYPFPT